MPKGKGPSARDIAFAAKMRAEIAAAAASASAAAVEKVVEKVITDSEKMLAVTYLSDSSRNKSDSDYAPSSEKVKRAVAKMKQAEANAEAELKERMAVASNSSSSNGPRLTAAQINTMQTLAAREAKAEASAAAAARNAAAGEAYRRRESKKVHVNPALRNSGKHETPEQYKARVKRDAKRRLGKEKEELNRAVGGSRRTRRNGRNGRNRH